LERNAHRWPGFDDAALAGWLGAVGCAPLPPRVVEGALPVRLWPARRTLGRVSAPAAVLTF
jgi:ArsR family transcriptional regulator